MNDLCQAHYNTGWNDIAHGIMEQMKDKKHPYTNALDWANKMKPIAEDMLPKAKGEHNRAYYNGVIACVEHFRKTGCMEKKLVV